MGCAGKAVAPLPGPITPPPVVNSTLNNIGIQGAATFGIGTTDNLPLGMSEMTGTRTVGDVNYGNYQYSDNSVMVWVPMFYYRWGGADSPRYAEYGLNSCDVKSKYDFADVAAANEAGYAVHRAFYDDGKLKDGVFVDKYLASNNAGTASSIKNGIPLSSASTNAPFSGLDGVPENTYAGAIDAVKTRGGAFFVTTIFIQRALSLLSMAHAQAATSIDNCAWYDATGIANYPKGCNNDALGDVDDATVNYTATGYLKAGKTGSATLFAKTTHNGQASGVADLNGNMFEICLGLTQLSGNFYALKTSAKAASLTSGATAANDAWGATGIAQNYESLGTSIGALTGTSQGMYIGSDTQQVFSSALTGKEWQASCAGIPQTGGVDATTGTDLFGHDRFYNNRVDDMCPRAGGYWGYGARAGVWDINFSDSRTDSSSSVGVRAALYSV
ncbi:hypothetical protein [Psychrobacter sp. 72-O-c]|uniref:hypothetical protein n=1 Tax=Psychrobacter sp. 72-O-c TaxID=2774125 RepID=UPI00191AC0B6|nr:hypothetical protein [Psychrobacter sp. 72-O-c]